MKNACSTLILNVWKYVYGGKGGFSFKVLLYVCMGGKSIECEKFADYCEIYFVDWT